MSHVFSKAADLTQTTDSVVDFQYDERLSLLLCSLMYVPGTTTIPTAAVVVVSIYPKHEVDYSI